MDQDLWLKSLHFHGPPLLQTMLGDPDDLEESGIDEQKLNMCKFIKSRLQMLFQPCEYTPEAPSDHSIPIVPIELYQNASNEERRDLFYKSLDRGNILILRVINDTLQDNYKLLVLCKQENYMKLDDLSIIMYLPKLPAELELAGGKLESNDLIRAAVCSCSIDERKLYVTLDSNFLEDESIKLGKITEKDLPFYLEKIDVGASYVEFLHHQPTFNSPNWSEELHTVLGLKRNYLYSFMEHLDGKTYAPVVYASELKKKQIINLSNEQHAKAVEHYENGNFTEAFAAFNRALTIYPKNVEALVSRGTLYSNTNNLRKAFIDMEKALSIDNAHEGARKQMSRLLVSVSRMHIEQNNMKKAQESLDAALNLDPNNKDAIVAIDEIKKLHATDKTSKPEKKVRIGSGSSDRSDSSSSRKDDKEKQESFLESSTRAFLSSMKKSHYDHKDKKSHHHRTHHKTRSKSPKRKSTLLLD